MFAIVSLAWAVSAAATDRCAVSFVDGWTPQAPPVAMMWAGYGTLRNRGDRTLTITGVSSPDFAMAQIHETRDENGVERMHRIDPLALPAGGEIRLAPRGKHIMLMRPAHDLGNADAVVVEFHVDGCAAPIRATLPIRREQR